MAKSNSLLKTNNVQLTLNGGKFKLYTVRNGLIFPKPTQPRISFEPLRSRPVHFTTVSVGCEIES
jgi:hypothetical protein